MRVAWKQVCPYQDIIYETAEGMAKLTINRPQVRNAFRPQTLFELQDAFLRAREDRDVGVIIFTGAAQKHSALGAISACEVRAATSATTESLA